MTVAQTTEPLYFNHSIAVKGPTIHIPRAVASGVKGGDNSRGPAYTTVLQDITSISGKKKKTYVHVVYSKSGGTVHKIEI